MQKKNGLLIGFYHYFNATNEDSARKQAAHFVNTTKPYVCNCKMALDIESNNNLSRSTLSSFCKIFLDEVKKLSGLDVVIYTYTLFAKEHLDNSLSIYPIWIAHYGVNTPGDNGTWNSWVGFQYSEKGKVNGINTDVDLDEFTSGILLKPSSIVEPPTPSKPNIIKPITHTTYVVKKGDTLSKIAIKFNTTVEFLIKLNKIKNPNFITPGQVLKIK